MTALEAATISIAGYAAVVATGAFFLEVRRWFEARPNLIISLIPDGVAIGGDPQFDERNICIVNVTNRGKEGTTLTNLLVFRNPFWYHRLLRRKRQTFVIPNPQLKGYAANIPSDLAPNKKWTGVIRKRPDVIPDLRNGEYYVVIQATHTDRDVYKRIPKPRKTPKGTETLT